MVINLGELLRLSCLNSHASCLSRIYRKCGSFTVLQLEMHTYTALLRGAGALAPRLLESKHFVTVLEIREQS